MIDPSITLLTLLLSSLLQPTHSFPITTAASIGDTRNDISGPCRPYTLIFARGTTAPDNIGGLGSQFAAALVTRLGIDNVAIQGVSAPAYPATWEGAYAPGGQDAGGQEMVDLSTEVRGKCPTTKLVWSGYSQGAMVAHVAATKAAQEDARLTDFVNSVVLFGDPERGSGFGDLAAGIQTHGTRMLNICHSVAPNIDLYCTHTGQGGAGHLTYADDLGAAVNWVVQKNGL